MRWALLLVWLATAAAVAVPRTDRHVVRLDSVPPGAEVFDGGAYAPDRRSGYLGTTPFSASLEAWRSHELYFVRPGYATARARLDLGEKSLTVRLQPTDPATWLRERVGLPGLAAAVLVLLVPVLRRRRRPSEPPADEGGILGRTLGDYRVVEKIAEGGFAEVFRVEHVDYGDAFALKLLKQGVDRATVQRFHREMAIGRDLHHPCLVQVFAFGEFRGAPWLVMELLEGRTLAERMEEGPLACEEALPLFRRICEGVAHAHRHGVIHRDLKPQNVLLTASGPRLLDLGIARMAEDSHLTVTGELIGTPLYMSPEHCHARVDSRSDLYSLGVVLFEMLSGHPPFGGNDPIEILMAHVGQPPPRLSGVPAPVDAAVARLLEKDPDRRFQTVEELLEALP